ncbi:hypothetical protein PAXRUDRAFT_149113 [Paxillus rubicundulus Ve08.2h10]|uniref:Unplaced genomic scaffold scaffold_545, whole genome shotgun sequence n=1 Tax=Paxillus rubicundulus Ve08.2h10 TaxID=930991 RepID=A0A0D0E3H7_9AGAM|nr:hypothetical protein PAXRUDRAFT_149113 [Paxillus rubicundulus Ve08.2h10]
MVNGLKRDQPQLFSRLYKGAIAKWIDKTEWQWSQATLNNVKNGHTLSGSGQSGVLACFPTIQDNIIERLKSLHQSGLPINVVVARSIMLAVIHAQAPELLTKFKCSEVSTFSVHWSV